MGRQIVAGLMKSGRRPLFNIVVVGLAAGLAGCAHEPPPAPPKPVAALPPPPPPTPPPVRHRVIPHPAHKPEAPTDGSAASEDTTVAMAVPEPGGNAPAPAAPPRASELIGLDQSAAARIFGAAAETAEEPPATVWRWRSPTCELDLFFYLDLRSGRMRSLRYAFKGDAADGTEQQDCLRSLAAARKT